MAKALPLQVVVVNGERYSCARAYDERDKIHIEDADFQLSKVLGAAHGDRLLFGFAIGDGGSGRRCFVRDMTFVQDDTSYPGCRTNFVLEQFKPCN